MRHALVITAALLLGSAPVVASAQETALSPEQVRGIAGSLLREGQVAEATVLANALLERDPNDVTALLIRTEAAFALGDFAGAAHLAARAYRVSETDTTSFIAARLAARAHAEQQQDTRAQIWLRRARQFSPTEAAAASVADDYQFLRMRNPWTTNLRFGITPSSNINNGSANDEVGVVAFGFFTPFDLSRDGQALGGLEVSAGATVQYRLRANANSATFLSAQVDGRTYKIYNSDIAELEAEVEQERADCRALQPRETDTPEMLAERIDQCLAFVDPTIAKGSDFSDATLAFGLTHRQILRPGAEPTTFRLGLSQTWYGGDPYTRALDASISHNWTLNETNRVGLSFAAQERRGVLDENRDGQKDVDPVRTYSLTGNWAHAFDNGDLLRISVGARDSQSETIDSDFNALQIGASYDIAQPLAGILFGFGVTLEDRRFDASRYTEPSIGAGGLIPGTRRDKSITARMDMQFTQIEYYGFQPLVTVEATRNSSDADLFDREYFRVGVDLRSSF